MPIRYIDRFMNSYVAPGHILALTAQDFHRDLFEKFLANGFLIQSPRSDDVFIGVNLTKSEKGEFLVDSFYHTKSYRMSPESLYKIQLSELLKVVDKWGGDFFEIGSPVDKDQEFLKDLHEIKDFFERDQKLEKLVAVTECEYAIVKGEHPIFNLKKLSELQGAVYGHWREQKGVLGVSPEPLFYKDNEKVFVRSLAGTISTEDANYAVTLLNDKKERHEHQLVIDDICQKLGDHIQNLKIEETSVRSFGKMAHLQTDMHFKTADLSSFNLINCLSPTAALGGFPKDKTQDYLKQLNYFHLEEDERYFGGVLGIDLGGISFALVGIRNIFWDHTQNKAHIHSGCGVVRESIPEKELDEVRRKRESIAGFFL